MPERLRPLDLRLLSMESSSTPMHAASLNIFEPSADGFDYSRVLALIDDRIAFVPKFRQRLLSVPGVVSTSTWTDDEHFDLAYHVRRSALPRPGSVQQLRELAARIVSRRLDRSRPLWEIYLIEGLEDSRYAVLTKSHLALVDGATVDLGQLLFDSTPSPPVTPGVTWSPQRPPSRVEMLGDAVASFRHPEIAADMARGQLESSRVAGRLVSLMRGATGRQTTSGGPLAGQTSQQRRIELVDTALSSYRTVRDEHGGSVNDVILATIAGALRSWLITRAEPVTRSAGIKTFAPVSVTEDEEAEPTSLGSRVTGHLVDLPVGESNPVVRLHQVSYAFKAHKQTGRAVAAVRLVALSGFAPSTFHALGERAAASQASRGFDLVITNVPGPQVPLYSAGARLASSYPVPPLLPGHTLAIGITSYNGEVRYGLVADRDAVPDADLLGQCILEALDELVEASARSRDRPSSHPPGTDQLP
jgi:diacylglycerol O-acyltransferase